MGYSGSQPLIPIPPMAAFDYLLVACAILFIDPAFESYEHFSRLHGMHRGRLRHTISCPQALRRSRPAGRRASSTAADGWTWHARRYLNVLNLIDSTLSARSPVRTKRRPGSLKHSPWTRSIIGPTHRPRRLPDDIRAARSFRDSLPSAATIQRSRCSVLRMQRHRCHHHLVALHNARLSQASLAPQRADDACQRSAAAENRRTSTLLPSHRLALIEMLVLQAVVSVPRDAPFPLTILAIWLYDPRRRLRMSDRIWQRAAASIAFPHSTPQPRYPALFTFWRRLCCRLPPSNRSQAADPSDASFSISATNYGSARVVGSARLGLARALLHHRDLRPPFVDDRYPWKWLRRSTTRPATEQALSGLLSAQLSTVEGRGRTGALVRSVTRFSIVSSHAIRRWQARGPIRQLERALHLSIRWERPDTSSRTSDID